MLERNSDRDVWKLENWDEYIKGENFSTPDLENIFVVDTTTNLSVKLGIEKILKAINK